MLKRQKPSPIVISSEELVSSSRFVTLSSNLVYDRETGRFYEPVVLKEGKVKLVPLVAIFYK